MHVIACKEVAVILSLVRGDVESLLSQELLVW